MITPPRHLLRGEALTATHHNALLDYCRRIMPIAGPGISVSRSMGGSVVGMDGGRADSTGTRPFTARWFDDGLRIYIPEGSVALSGVTVEMESGDGEDTPGWYKVIDAPQEGVFHVDVHVKGRVSVKGSHIHPVVTATAYPGTGVDTPEHRAGDVHAFTACSASAENRTVSQSWTGPVSVQIPRPRPLELFWRTDGEGSSSYAPTVEHGTFSIGGARFSLESDEAVSSDEDVYGVWLILECEGDHPQVSVSTERSTTETSVSIQIYVILHGGELSFDGREGLYSTVFYP